MPEVSICIPTYNGSQHLEACIASARAQSFRDLEIVVCDDASTDATVAIAERLAVADPRIRVCRNTRNLGLVGNWNRAITQSRGTWTKLLFQDDLLDVDCVQKLRTAAQRENTCVVGCFRRFLFEPSTPPETQDFYRLNKALIDAFWIDEVATPDAIIDFAIKDLGNNFFGEPTVSLIHREVFEAIGFFDPMLTQRCDTEFWIRAGVNFGLRMVKEDLATFRVHSRSTSAHNYDGSQFSDRHLDPSVLMRHVLFSAAYEPIRRRLESTHRLAAFRRAFYRRCCVTKRHATRMDRKVGHDYSDRWAQVASAYPEIDRIPWWTKIDVALRSVWFA